MSLELIYKAFFRRENGDLIDVVVRESEVAMIEEIEAFERVACYRETWELTVNGQPVDQWRCHNYGKRRDQHG